MRRLGERSEPSRSWMGGRAEGAQRVSAINCDAAQLLALLRARAARAAPPPIQLRLSSAAPRQGSASFPRKGGRGGFYGSPCHMRLPCCRREPRDAQWVRTRDAEPETDLLG